MTHDADPIYFDRDDALPWPPTYLDDYNRGPGHRMPVRNGRSDPNHAFLDSKHHQRSPVLRTVRYALMSGSETVIRRPLACPERCVVLTRPSKR
jgi:hypothetical protein